MRSSATALVLLALLAGCGTTSGSGDRARSAPPADVRVIVLEYTVPEEITATLDEVFADRGVRVVPNAATNSIVVTGEDDEIVRLLDLVARLDVPR